MDKRLLVLILSVSLLFTLAGCSEKMETYQEPFVYPEDLIGQWKLEKGESVDLLDESGNATEFTIHPYIQTYTADGTAFVYYHEEHPDIDNLVRYSYVVEGNRIYRDVNAPDVIETFEILSGGKLQISITQNNIKKIYSYSKTELDVDPDNLARQLLQDKYFDLFSLNFYNVERKHGYWSKTSLDGPLNLDYPVDGFKIQSDGTGEMQFSMEYNGGQCSWDFNGGILNFHYPYGEKESFALRSILLIQGDAYLTLLKLFPPEPSHGPAMKSAADEFEAIEFHFQN